MRVRKVDENGDYVFGHGGRAYHQNTPDAVGVLVEARVHLWLGEWFLDTSEGTPYREQVLGRHTEATRDIVLRTRVLSTEGVTGIPAGGYSAVLDRETRGFTAAITIDTAFGVTLVTPQFGEAA